MNPCESCPIHCKGGQNLYNDDCEHFLPSMYEPMEDKNIEIRYERVPSRLPESECFADDALCSEEPFDALGDRGRVGFRWLAEGRDYFPD